MQANRQDLLKFNINIKIVHKKQVFSLGRNIQSYEDLIDQTKIRFPDIESFQFALEGKILLKSDFIKLMEKKIQENQSSIKFQMKIVHSDCKGLVKKSKNYHFDASFSQQKLAKSKKFSFNENEISDSQNQSQAKRNDNIFPKQICFKKFDIQVDIKIQFFNLSKEINQEYYWSCYLTNYSRVKIVDSLYIQDLITKKIANIKQLDANSTKQIQLGPFKQNQIGNFAHLFELIYSPNSNIHQKIGHKFGFVCHADKFISKRKVVNKLFEKIHQLKNFTSCQKSTENVILGFKQLGIGQKEIDSYDNQAIVQLIESIKLLDNLNIAS